MQNIFHPFMIFESSTTMVDVDVIPSLTYEMGRSMHFASLSQLTPFKSIPPFATVPFFFEIFSSIRVPLPFVP